MNVPFLQTATFTGLVSTDEYYTSQEWSQAYDIATFYSQNSAILIEQTTFTQLTSLKANNQLKPGQLYQINDFQLMWWNHDSVNTLKTAISGEPLIVQAVTNNKIASEALSVLHSDDIVYYDIDATTSTTWKAGPSAIPGFKGWIYRRINLTRNIDIAWDWRYITNNCCKYDLTPVQLYSSGTTYSKNSLVKTAGNKLYISVQNNNIENSVTSITWWRAVTPYTNDSVMYYPTDEQAFVFGQANGVNYFETVLGLIPDVSSRISLPTFAEHMNDPNVAPTDLSLRPKINNIKIDSGYNNVFMTNTASKQLNALIIGPGCRFNIITTTSSLGSGGSGGLYNCRIGGDFAGNLVTNLFTYNVIGDLFQNNIFNNTTAGRLIISNSFQKNIVGPATGLGGIPNQNIIGDSCTGNFFLGVTNCIIGQNYKNNVSSTNFRNNRIGNACSGNFLNSNYSDNIIGNNFQNNIIQASCLYNKIGDTFQSNTIDTNFTYNTLGNNCTNNNIEIFCSYNNISNEFSYNTIGSDFQSNTIQNYFTNNTIGNNFNFNNISNGFQSNTTGPNFTLVNTANNINSINFLGATHVYNNYDKNIFNNANSIERLSYFNSNDQLVVTDPTA